MTNKISLLFKKTFLLFVFAFLCGQAIAKTIDNVFISGYIANFAKLDKSIYIDKTVSVEYYTPIGQSERRTANIDRNGKFSLSFYLLHPQDILIQAGTGSNIKALVIPNDTVRIVLRYFKKDQATQGYPNKHYDTNFDNAFTGANADRLSVFVQLYLDACKLPFLKTDWTGIANNIDLLNNKLDKIPGIIKTEFSRADTTTIKWLESFLSCAIIDDFILQSQNQKLIIDYKRINFSKSTYKNFHFFQTAKRISVPDSVDNQVRRTSVLNNPNFRLSKSEALLLDNIFAGKATGADTTKARTIEERYKANARALISADSIYCIAASAYYKQALPTELADIKNGRLVKNNYLSSFFDKAKPTIFKGMGVGMQYYLNAEILTNNALKKNITYAKSTNADIVKVLIAKFPGKNMYVDLWATWCGPCRDEFPYYPELIDKYKNKVTFVFLCGASPEDTYKTVLNKLDFKANHFFLSDKQYANYKNTFGITGIPHYIFINKSGKIVNNFKRPSSRLDLYAAIDKEIEENAVK